MTAPRSRSALLGALCLAAVTTLAACSSAADASPKQPAGHTTATATASATASPTSSASATPTSSPTSSTPSPAATSVHIPAQTPALTPYIAPSIGVSTLPPVSARKTAAFGNGLAVQVTRTKAVAVTARGPGEISGPGVEVTLSLRNGSTVPVDMGGITVTASYGTAHTPAMSIDGSPAAPPSGVLAPGETAQGTWVFTVPTKQQGSVVLQVGSTSASDVVQVTLG